MATEVELKILADTSRPVPQTVEAGTERWGEPVAGGRHGAIWHDGDGQPIHLFHLQGCCPGCGGCGDG